MTRLLFAVYFFSTPVILIPACFEPCCLLILMSTLVSPSTTTEFSIGPASQPVNPADFNDSQRFGAGILACAGDENFTFDIYHRSITVHRMCFGTRQQPAHHRRVFPLLPARQNRQEASGLCSLVSSAEQWRQSAVCL